MSVAADQRPRPFDRVAVPSRRVDPVSLTPAILARLAGLYVASRLLVVVLVKVTAWIDGGRQTIYGSLTAWDSQWYGAIAKTGYAPYARHDGIGDRWAFFPGWPSLLRFVGRVFGGSWQRNGLILAVVLSFVTVVVFYLVVAEVLGSDTAMRACALLVFAPTSAVLSMVYSEVLFLLCVVACMLFLARHRWWLACIAAMVGASTRLAGVALIACCAVEIAPAAWRQRRLRLLVPLAITPVGIVGYFVLQRVRTGSFDAYSTAQTFWHNENTFGAEAFGTTWKVLTSLSAWGDAEKVLVMFAVVTTVASLVVMIRRRALPRSWWILTAVVVAIGISPAVIHSIPRFLLPAVPLTAVVAHRARGKAFAVVLFASTALMCATTVIYFSTVRVRMAP